MTDETAVQEAHRLLDAATKGEWVRKQYTEDGERWYRIVAESGGWIVDKVVNAKNAALIAAAPRLLRELVAEVERLKAENDTLQINMIMAQPFIDDMAAGYFEET